MSTEYTEDRPYLDPEALARVGGLKLRARRVVEGVLAGLHRSPHKGSSVEFAEYKEYAPGDEIRHIDWKAYGKSDKYYVKQFEEETNLRAWMLLDVSGSMDFGSGEVTKLDYGATLVASLAHLLLRQGDAAGLQTFDQEPRIYIPPSGRSTHLQDMISVLEAVEPGGDGSTDIATVLQNIAERVRRRSLIVLISDMLDTSPQVGHLLHVLRSRKMDVVVFHLVDRDEITLPYEGLTLFEGLENEGQLLVDPDDIRQSYLAAFTEHLNAVRDTCQQASIEYHRVVTDTPYEEPLLTMLRGRTSRALKGRGRGGLSFGS